MESAHLFGRHEVPIPEDLLPPRPAHIPAAPTKLTAPAPAPGSFGVNVAGHLRGELGLGEAARLVVSALDAAGIPALPVDIGSASSFRAEHPIVAADPGPLPFPVTIVCANPDSLWMLASAQRPGAVRGPPHDRDVVVGRRSAARRSNGSGPPRSWTRCRCGSGFRQRRGRRPDGGHALAHDAARVVAPTGPPDRARFGLPDGFLFLFVYDRNGTLRRGPPRVIEAFRLAFPPGSAVQSVFSNRFMRFLGDVSFGVFLFHFLVIWGALGLFDLPRDGSLNAFLLLTAIVLPVTVLCGWLGTKYVERPIRERARALAERRRSSELQAAARSSERLRAAGGGAAPANSGGAIAR